jgi:protein DJ-1
MNVANKKRALVVLAEGAEEMEATIAIDVLRRAGVEVVVAGLDGTDPVVCSRMVRIVPDVALATASGPWDVVVLPGGAEGARRLAGSAIVGALLSDQRAAGGVVAAICAAPAALRAHGLFGGSLMTCHPSVEKAVAQHATIAPGAVVVDGNLITSRGPGTAFEFALTLVAQLVGTETADTIRQAMVVAPDHP